jgi:hypothetical protein
LQSIAKEAESPSRCCSYDKPVFGDLRERRQNPHPQTPHHAASIGPGLRCEGSSAFLGNIFGAAFVFLIQGRRVVSALRASREPDAMSRAILPWVPASMEVTQLCVTPLHLSDRIVGTVPALGLTRLIATLLCGVKPTDPLTYAEVATGRVAVALLACLLPARRAILVDPLVALRHD